MSSTENLLEQITADAMKSDDPISQAIVWMWEPGAEKRWNKKELDEVLTVYWPRLVRAVMADGSDEWVKGFVRSIAKHGKRASWRPSEKQEQIMRGLLSEKAAEAFSTGEVIED